MLLDDDELDDGGVVWRMMRGSLLCAPTKPDAGPNAITIAKPAALIAKPTRNLAFFMTSTVPSALPPPSTGERNTSARHPH